MPDDIKVPDESAGAGPEVATDDIGGRHFQIVKLAFGSDGSVALVGDAALPVALDAASLAALETISVGNFPATQPISAAALPLPAGAGTEATLAALKAVADTLAATAAAIQAAAEAINAKTTAMNTGAIAGTVALDAGSLAALETVSVGNAVALDATALAALGAAATPGTQPVSGPLTDAQLRAASLGVDFWVSLLAVLRQIADPVTMDPASGRLRVMLDAAGGAQTLATVTTVTTCSTVTNMAQLGGIAANSAIYDAMDAAYAHCMRPRIA